MEYEKEYENLKENVQQKWWKPNEGIHKITFLENVPKPEPKTFKMPDGTIKALEQSDVKIDVNKEVVLWSITKSLTKDSLWGQIIFLGTIWKDLTGKTITVLVTGKDKQKKYMIQEVLELKQKQTTITQ